jgi:hypothetical protein
MTEGMTGGSAPLKHTRDVTIDALMEHFANDVMDVDEFERRVGAAHAARTSEELKALLHDLPGNRNLPAVPGGETLPAEARIPSYQVTTAANVKEKEFILAMMGGGSRRGRWRPARKNTVVTIMGGAELDFREAVLGPGVTEVQVFALFGGTEVIVPPGMNVEVNGLALMGGFDHQTDESVQHDPTAPTLRITGVACMGGVDVNTRYPGESARDARRRRKQLRREQRRRLRGG